VPARIEDYGLIGDTQSVALVSRSGSIDWLCLPRFDSPACFAALLGSPENGRWLLRPAGDVRDIHRRYRDGSPILETDYVTEDGAVTVVECMPPRDETPDLVRVVHGRTGQVHMRMELVIRFDYGSIVPWVRRVDGGLMAIGGPDALILNTPIDAHGEDFRTVAEFTIDAGDIVPFTLTWFPSHRPPPPPRDPVEEIEDTERWWSEWSAGMTYDGPWKEAVASSLVTLKALTYAPTGGIAAAATTSLPERLGGVRNWDYRYCWLRDATSTLDSLLLGGHTDEARAWRDWLVRTVAGDPADLQIMYGVAGERRLTELELPWLPGYEGSAPVRVGNLACHQMQHDVYGEVMDALHDARLMGIEPHEVAWSVQREMLSCLEDRWREPDEGIWEVRDERRHFTHSKVMAWVAFDRGVHAADEFGLDGSVARWRATRDEIRRDVCDRGYDPERNVFVQVYDEPQLDASLLMIPMVGFLPPEDPRVRGTVEAIERELTQDGFVLRYRTEETEDGLPPGEGTFIMCTFWLAQCLDLIGRHDDACELFERLLAVRNDLGLLSEEYDPRTGRLLGNFPQAFSHTSLVTTAMQLSGAVPDLHHRCEY